MTNVAKFGSLFLVIVIITSVIVYPNRSQFGFGSLANALSQIKDVPALYNKDSGFISSTIDILTFPIRFINWCLQTLFNICYYLIGSAVTDILFGGAT